MSESSKDWRAVAGDATKALLAIVQENQRLDSSELEKFELVGILLSFPAHQFLFFVCLF